MAGRDNHSGGAPQEQLPSPELEALRDLCAEAFTVAKRAGVGKRTRSDLYLHRSVLRDLGLARARDALDAVWRRVVQHPRESWTLVRIASAAPAVSLLQYPTFDEEAHPALTLAVRFSFTDGAVRVTEFRGRDNPPILHRKELFVTPDYPGFSRFAELTSHEEAAGLLARAHEVGYRNQWQRRLSHYGYSVNGHELIKHSAP